MLLSGCNNPGRCPTQQQLTYTYDHHNHNPDASFTSHNNSHCNPDYANTTTEQNTHAHMDRFSDLHAIFYLYKNTHFYRDDYAYSYHYTNANYNPHFHRYADTNRYTHPH